MTIPNSATYVVVGAGIHGLSTAWHLASRIGREDQVVVLDKGGIGAGASGIVCGVVRNNYFQSAMRELMAHSVSVWESDPKAFSYHPVGYMQIAPEVMHGNIAQIYEEQRSIGYPSTLVEGEANCRLYMQGPVLRLAGQEHHDDPPRAPWGLRQQPIIAARAGEQGRRGGSDDPCRCDRHRTASRWRSGQRSRDRSGKHRLRPRGHRRRPMGA